jgi:hypothetical protein
MVLASSELLYNKQTTPHPSTHRDCTRQALLRRTSINTARGITAFISQKLFLLLFVSVFVFLSEPEIQACKPDSIKGFCDPTIVHTHAHTPTPRAPPQARGLAPDHLLCIPRARPSHTLGVASHVSLHKVRAWRGVSDLASDKCGRVHASRNLIICRRHDVRTTHLPTPPTRHAHTQSLLDTPNKTHQPPNKLDLIRTHLSWLHSNSVVAKGLLGLCCLPVPGCVALSRSYDPFPTPSAAGHDNSICK